MPFQQKDGQRDSSRHVFSEEGRRMETGYSEPSNREAGL